MSTRSKVYSPPSVNHPGCQNRSGLSTHALSFCFPTASYLQPLNSSLTTTARKEAAEQTQDCTTLVLHIYSWPSQQGLSARAQLKLCEKKVLCLRNRLQPQLLSILWAFLSRSETFCCDILALSFCTLIEEPPSSAHTGYIVTAV